MTVTGCRRRQNAGDDRAADSGDGAFGAMHQSNGHSAASRPVVVASAGTRRSDGGDERGGGQKHGELGDGENERDLERALVRSATGSGARKVARTESQMGAPGHGHEKHGGGGATAPMAATSTATGEDRKQLGKERKLTVSLQVCLVCAEEARGGGNRRRTAADPDWGRWTVRSRRSFRARFLR